MWIIYVAFICKYINQTVLMYKFYLDNVKKYSHFWTTKKIIVEVKDELKHIIVITKFNVGQRDSITK